MAYAREALAHLPPSTWIDSGVRLAEARRRVRGTCVPAHAAA
ncbi:MAG TPA: hypothetical protein VKB12_19205 [Pyrinomonadaceae bacterium]|nr:hypothetical protein [Pyrinomonadaceae bacterium]